MCAACAAERHIGTAHWNEIMHLSGKVFAQCAKSAYLVHGHKYDNLSKM